MNITIFNENVGELLTAEDKQEYRNAILAVHPNGIHNTLKELVEEMDGVTVRTATPQDPEFGLSDEVLDNTDVLLWWAHLGHDAVSDELVEKIHHRVLAGMGILFLHSAHYSKAFKKILGTTGDLRWKDDAYERIFNINPAHPIAQGIPEHFELGIEECYAECFDIPKPDDVVFLGWFDYGEVFRSGCTWTRGYGKVFYFQPGHETNLSYKHPHVRRIIKNAVAWAYTENKRTRFEAPQIGETLEQIRLGSAKA